MISCVKAKEVTEENETVLIRNGGMLLEKSIALNNGRGNPIRCFSLKEITKLTNNFHQNQVISDNDFLIMYKGFLQGRPVIVKKFEENCSVEEAISDIAFSSQMSVHKNVLKLLGCCLESNIPILVLEYAEKEMLEKYVYREYRAQYRPLSWKNRLKIAVDIANVVAYLHTAFPKPIVHRDLKIRHIMLEEENVVKVSDFSFSISIPEGDTHVIDTVVEGTYGYLAPEYCYSGGTFNEKIDVYSFGVILFVLLTGKKAYDPCPPAHGHHLLVDLVKNHAEEQKLDEMIDPIIVEERPWPEKEQQLKAFALLAFHCTDEIPEDRPEITDVGKQLRQMYQSLISNCVHQH